MPTLLAPSALSVTTQRKDLLEGVQSVLKAVSTRTTLPILGHVLVRQDEETGQVRLTATDLEMWIEHALPRSQEGFVGIAGGAATAPARNFAELLAAFPETTVELSSEETSGGQALHLRCNRANYKLLGLAPEDFPVLPRVAENTHLTVSRSVLREAIRQTAFAVSGDESRAILTGILLSYRSEVLRLVATDTHRLAVRPLSIVDGYGSDAQAVIPARAMQEVLRILGSEGEGTVDITISDNQVLFRASEQDGSSTTLISRLIEGQFPNFERVVPQSYTRKLTIERDSLLFALKRAAIFARTEGSANRVVLRTDDLGQSLTITAISDNLGNAFEEVEIALEGPDSSVEIAFNVKYLIDVLNVLDTEGLHLELSEPLRPGVVRPVGETDYFCVLMPMQVV